MLQNHRSALLLLLFSAAIPVAAAFQTWEKSPESAGPRELYAVLPHPFGQEKMLLATSHQVFETQLKTAGMWKPLSSFPSDPSGIQRLLYFPQTPGQLFALTQNRIFKIQLGRVYPESVFQPRHGEQVTGFTILPDKSHWMAGTTRGLYESTDAGKSWSLVPAYGSKEVCFLASTNDALFTAGADTLFISKEDGLFKKVLTRFQAQETEDSGESQEWSEEDKTPARACYFHEMISDSNHVLWVASEGGVFNSMTGGENWSAIPQRGLLTRSLHFLAYSEKDRMLFAASSSAVYAFLENEGRWEEISRGLPFSEIRGLSFNPAESRLFAATSNGLFHFLLPDHVTMPSMHEISPDQKLLFQQLVRLEPTAAEVHRAVIRYADTKNSKIKSWQAESRLRALLPHVSVGKDFSRGSNNDIDRGGTNNPDLFISGPDNVSKKWDVSVGWDLGDFIFSSSQTAIDSREKLMVELRQDLTSEATRLYYERRRLQMETIFQPAASEFEHLDRLLRIEELTGLLDAMSGGYFSKRLEQIYRGHPEFENRQNLWEFQRK